MPDFNSRPTMASLLSHTWLLEEGSGQRNAVDQSSARDLAERLSAHVALSRLKRAALMAAVGHMKPYDHEQLRACFRRVDVLNRGSINASELVAALDAADCKVDTPGTETNSCPIDQPARSWVEQLFYQLDSNGSGEIEYTEFLAAIMNQGIEDHKDLAMAAFRCFDAGGKGFISKSDLKAVLGCGVELEPKPSRGGSKPEIRSKGVDVETKMRCGSPELPSPSDGVTTWPLSRNAVDDVDAIDFDAFIELMRKG